MKTVEMNLLADRMVALGLISSNQAIRMSSEDVLYALIKDCVNGEAKAADLEALADEGLRQRREFRVGYTPHLWGTLEDILLAQGFEAEVVSRKSSNVNVVYRHEDVPYVVIIMKSLTYNISLPLLMDKEDYDALSMKANGKRSVIYFTTCSGSSGSRGSKGGGELRFQLGCNMIYRSVVMRRKEDFNKKNDVDHVAVNPCICTREYLREATNAQNNSYHIVTPCKISDNKLSFTYSSGSEAVIKAVEKLMKNKAFKKFTYKATSKRVSVQSPQYSSEEDMYTALAEFEDALFGEYRYDPIIACPKSISMFLMILWKIGLLTDEDYRKARIYEYKCRGESEMLAYYQVM